MADDIFGDDELFAEFDRDREQQKIFIHYDKDESGIENRSRIIFNNAESESDDSDIEILPNPSDALNFGVDRVPTQLESVEDLQKQNDSGQTTESYERASEDEMFSGSVKSDEKKDYDTSDQCSQSQTTTYKETFEKSKLRTFAKLIDSTRCIGDEESPGVQIIFHNNHFAKKYRGKIEQFLIDLMHHAENKDFCKPAVDLSCQPRSVLTCVDINDTLPAEKRTKNMWQIHGIIGCTKYHHTFMVDAQGWSQEAGGESMETVYGEMPKYQQMFQQIFPVDETASADENKIAKPKNSCFNCGGDHRLNECKTPKDHERIRNKRREHQDKNAAKNSNPGRYHEDPELNPNQKKFEAGQISDSLREAMGLKPNQLPIYIYRMRLFGYPPGWLMEANRKSQNLAMYDRDGHETSICGESLEDGECVDQANGTEVFDINKIIEYPGFTIPVPPGFVDESALIGMPPVQEHQLKKTLMEDIVTKDKNKKRRLEEEEDLMVKKLKAQAEDMDLDDEDENHVVPNNTKTEHGLDKVAVETEQKEENKILDTERLTEDDKEIIENKKEAVGQVSKRLVKENPQGADDKDMETQEVVDLDTTATSVMAVNGSVPSTPCGPPSSSPEAQAAQFREKNFSFTPTGSICKDYGTPILVREGSFQQLPATEKFQQGIEDHIPYENLPDAVGTFERMRNIFGLIRDKVRRARK